MEYEEWLVRNKHIIQINWCTAVLVDGRFETCNLGETGNASQRCNLGLGTVKVSGIYTESFAQLFRFWFHIAIEV
jgi:hypothetical protein